MDRACNTSIKTVKLQVVMSEYSARTEEVRDRCLLLAAKTQVVHTCPMPK